MELKNLSKIVKESTFLSDEEKVEIKKLRKERRNEITKTYISAFLIHSGICAITELANNIIDTSSETNKNTLINRVKNNENELENASEYLGELQAIEKRRKESHRLASFFQFTGSMVTVINQISKNSSINTEYNTRISEIIDKAKAKAEGEKS